MMKLAGICVVAAVALSAVAQQSAPPKKGPPSKATAKPPVKGKVVTQPPAKQAPPKKAPAKQAAPKVVTSRQGSTVSKKTVITANGTTVTTTTVVTPGGGSTAGSSSHRRRTRRRVRTARRSHGHSHVASNRSNFSTNTNAETGLVGIRLFDSGLKVLAMYGNPDMILSLGQVAPAGGGGGNGGAPAFGGGGGGGGGAPGGRGGGPMGKAGGGRGSVPGERLNSGAEYNFQDDTLERAQAPGTGVDGRGGGQGLPPSGGGPPVGRGNFGGPPGGSNFGGGAPASQGAAGTVAPATYTRWVYKHGPSQYAFIIDKLNRVVQIEVVGMDDPKVHTNRGVTFGATFKQLMQKYGNPDAFEIGGDTLVMRYLARSHVAFRLNRLDTDKPHEVTAIVVAGGKG